jgi:hypothetical protein
MPRRNLGVDGEIELAEMPTLAPFAQVIADMGWFASIGSRRGSLCVHGGKSSMRISCFPLRRR